MKTTWSHFVLFSTILSSAFTLHAATYYLESGDGQSPPYPVDPYHGTLPVSEISPDCYLIHDTLEDFDNLWKQTRVQTQAMAFNPMTPMTPHFDSSELHVDSLSLSGTNLVFAVGKLNPGDEYLITRKKVLDNGFTNNWVPEWSFVAADTNETLSIPIPTDSDAGFYLIIDYTAYQGPTPVIGSPADNSTVSGVIQVNAGLLDIFRADQATLYVDGVNYGTVTNGVASWSLDTALLANGSHSVEADFISEIPFVDDSGSNNVQLWTSSAMLYSLMTSNSLAENVAPRNFTIAYGTVPFAFDTMDPAVVTVQVFDATGTNLLWNTSVTNETGGTCYPYWNLLDNDGNPVPLPNSDESITYNVTVSAQPIGFSPNIPSNPRSFSMTMSTDPHAGHTAVFGDLYGFFAPAGINDNQSNLLAGTISWVQTAYTIHPADSDGYERDMNSVASPFIFAQDSDFPFFFNVLTNQATGQFLYICDSDGTSFGSGTRTVTSDTIGNGQVANVFGTYINDNMGDRYGHRVRLADIEACNSASKNLNRSFGSPDGLDSFPALSKSSFVGWTITIHYTGSYLPNTVYEKEIKYWQSYWTDSGFDDGVGIQHANYQCLSDAGASTDIQLARRIRGSKNMTWIKKD